MKDPKTWTTWDTIDPFGEYAVAGAILGMEFGPSAGTIGADK